MDTMKPVEIRAEVTPNPNTLKFNVNRTLIETGSLNFPDKEKAKGATLPEALFDIENVLGVMVRHDFVTVTKLPGANWKLLVEPIISTLKKLFEAGKIVFPQGSGVTASASTGTAGGLGEIEKKIRQILDDEIRPAVAMDGGDITFHGFSDGIVTLHLQGSCSSCPSSIMTLKMGVENRLKSLIPEVREVVQI